MLHNNADVRRCSYFELGLPVMKHTLETIVICNIQSVLYNMRKHKRIKSLFFHVSLINKN